MNKTAWKNAIEAIGVLSIVASLIFVGLEVQQSTRAAIDASLSSDTSIIIDTESLVLSHPDVWRRGCLAELSDPTEQLIYSRIHHAYVFNYYLRWLRSTMGMESSSEQLAVDNVAMNIYRYTGFQAEWDAHAYPGSTLTIAFDCRFSGNSSMTELRSIRRSNRCPLATPVDAA